MKTIVISLVVFSAVLFISSAVPVDTGHEEHSSLIRPDLYEPEDKEGLQRRKPPVKIPGPKLGNAEANTSETSQSEEKEMKQLSNNGNKNNKGKGHLHEETQTEKPNKQ